MKHWLGGASETIQAPENDENTVFIFNTGRNSNRKVRNNVSYDNKSYEKISWRLKYKVVNLFF